MNPRITARTCTEVSIHVPPPVAKGIQVIEECRLWILTRVMVAVGPPFFLDDDSTDAPRTTKTNVYVVPLATNQPTNVRRWTLTNMSSGR